ncbi:MAG: hypothetical protein JNL18_13795 [Planctomycetaceae bacterium]|nr:hypothetical protein [Planctomycetaceae bacterium]
MLPRYPLLRRSIALALTLGAACAVNSLAVVRAEIAFEASWQPPSYQVVREQVLSWLEEADLQTTAEASVRRLWPARPPESLDASQVLDLVAASLAASSREAADLVAACNAAYEGPAVADPEWLSDPEVAPLVRHNLRLYYARWLAQYGLYDEVLHHIGDLRPPDVVDPASLLFYQMVAYHQLVRPDDARAAMVQLLERDDALPRRFQQVAQLVERDLAGLEDESLDHIARRMHDIRRRLAYGRAGVQVQEIEQGVLDSLDKKIEDLEKQQQQQQASASAGSGGAQQPAQGMQDSKIAELKAPMQVDRRDIGNKSGWGDLPPKEREQALQQIGREFPAHYRELVEQYFRELANEQNPTTAEK